LIKGGVCHPMEDDRGSGGMSTFLFQDQSGEARCIPYYFKVSRVSQEEVFYPSTGSLIVPVGAGDCPEWEDTRLPADCAPGQGVESDGPPLGGTGQGCGDPSGDPNAAYGAEETAYGSCSQGGKNAPRRLGLLLVVLLPSFLRRRRL
jgi:hypothetical protein